MKLNPRSIWKWQRLISAICARIFHKNMMNRKIKQSVIICSLVWANLGDNEKQFRDERKCQKVGFWISNLFYFFYTWDPAPRWLSLATQTQSRPWWVPHTKPYPQKVRDYQQILCCPLKRNLIRTTVFLFFFFFFSIPVHSWQMSLPQCW